MDGQQGGPMSLKVHKGSGEHGIGKGGRVLSLKCYIIFMYFSGKGSSWFSPPQRLKKVKSHQLCLNHFNEMGKLNVLVMILLL